MQSSPAINQLSERRFLVSFDSPVYFHGLATNVLQTGYQHKPITAYQPRNGMVEKIHWELKASLRACLDSQAWLGAFLGCCWVCVQPQRKNWRCLLQRLYMETPHSAWGVRGLPRASFGLFPVGPQRADVCLPASCYLVLQPPQKYQIAIKEQTWSTERKVGWRNPCPPLKGQ
jgi:hypothetical protein